MKVKVKLDLLCQTVLVNTSEGVTTRAPFLEALAAVRKLPLPARTFYWLNKLSATVEREFADYEAARINLVVRLAGPLTPPLPVGHHSPEGEREPNGILQVPAERAEEFAREMESLNREVELPLDDSLKLVLPAIGVADDWLPLMRVLDIFAEPL